jgi:hypothetical protein
VIFFYSSILFGAGPTGPFTAADLERAVARKA